MTTSNDIPLPPELQTELDAAQRALEDAQRAYERVTERADAYRVQVWSAMYGLRIGDILMSTSAFYAHLRNERHWSAVEAAKFEPGQLLTVHDIHTDNGTITVEAQGVVGTGNVTLAQAREMREAYRLRANEGGAR